MTSKKTVHATIGLASSKRALRRAPHACVRCRVRKVRCDVTIQGSPCTNCSLDHDECRVVSTDRTRRRSHGIRKLSADDPPIRLVGHGDRDHDTHCEQGGCQTEPRRRDRGTRGGASTSSTTVQRFILEDPAQADTHKECMVSRRAEDHGGGGQEQTINGGHPPLVDDAITSPYYIGYSYYRFLALDNISSMPARDYKFLEQEGCLHVPIPLVLDVFVRQYFLHMHSMLPILDEGNFWDVYNQRFETPSPSRTISLLILQTMLFASCNFVPQKTLDQVGFSTARHARAAFHRRAKLLFDLEADSSSITKAQAALLLASSSFSSYEFPRKPSKPWLSIAIQHARDAEAHNYKAFSGHPAEYIARKRLWWCCIIRDRLFSLGMRRPIQITSAQFDVGRESGLGYYDLVGEVHRSQVHDVSMKARLVDTLELLVQLCTILTDVLELAFPIEANLMDPDYSPETQLRVRNCRIALRKWHAKALAATATDESNKHDSVFLCTNLIYMYYHLGKATLGHFEILRVATSAVSSPMHATNIMSLEHNHFELQNAALEITSCLQKLAYRGLIKWLPITAVSCTALPLLLHIIGIEVSSSTRIADSSQHSNLMAQRLDVLQTAMETYQCQYEGASWINETINRVVTIIRAGSASSSSSSSSSAAAAAEESRSSMRVNPQPSAGEEQATTATRTGMFLTFQPTWYLRMAFSIDVALSKGRLPKDQNLFRSFHDLLIAEMADSQIMAGSDHCQEQEEEEGGRLCADGNNLSVMGTRPADHHHLHPHQNQLVPPAVCAAAPIEQLPAGVVAPEPPYAITQITDSWEFHLFGSPETDQVEEERDNGTTGQRLASAANTVDTGGMTVTGAGGLGIDELDSVTFLGNQDYGVSEELCFGSSPEESALRAGDDGTGGSFYKLID